jgi:hypothetical protein
MQSDVESVKLQFDHVGGSAFCDSCRVIQRPCTEKHRGTGIIRAKNTPFQRTAGNAMISQIRSPAHPVAEPGEFRISKPAGNP